MQRRQSPRDRERQRLETLIAKLEQEEPTTTEFYDRAAEAAELLLKLGVSERADLEEILKRRDEIRYGARNSFSFLKADEKERLIARLKKQKVTK